METLLQFGLCDEAAKKPVSTVEEASRLLRSNGDRVVLAFDSFELFRMVGTWLRLTVIPSLADNVRVFFFGREAPVSAWLIEPEWQGLFHSVTLGPLDDCALREMLAKCGLAEPELSRIVRFARGIPLALRLAAASVLERPGLDLEKITSQTVVAELTRTYVSDVQDPRPATRWRRALFRRLTRVWCCTIPSGSSSRPHSRRRRPRGTGRCGAARGATTGTESE